MSHRKFPLSARRFSIGWVCASVCKRTANLPETIVICNYRNWLGHINIAFGDNEIVKGNTRRLV